MICCRYPSDKTLLNSYKSESKWVDYREHVVDSALQPLLHQSRHHQILCEENTLRATKKSKESRLLTTLRRNQRHEQRLLNLQRKGPVASGLDIPELPDQDGEFRVMCNRDDNTSRSNRDDASRSNRDDASRSSRSSRSNRNSRLSSIVDCSKGFTVQINDTPIITFEAPS